MDAEDSANACDSGEASLAPTKGRRAESNPASHMPDFGVYIHYPFCETKCPYCDFASVGWNHDESPLAGGYFDALERELDLWLEARPDLAGRETATVFFGGGTPSLSDPAELGAFLGVLRARFTFAPEVEITLEANPGTIDEERLRAFREAGVNRVSFGIQSFAARELEALGRRHTPADSRAALPAARAAGFDNRNGDLIFAVPGQSPAELRANLEEMLEFGPEHISVYGLTIYEGTPFHSREKLGLLTLPGEEAQAEMFLDSRRLLLGRGYVHYEISNYALPGRECRHNRLYWNGGDWLGLGVSAHGSLGGVRHENPHGIRDWLARVGEGRLPSREEEAPGEQSAFGEAVMLGLRQREGISLDALGRRFGAGASSRADRLFRPLVEEGYVVQLGRRRALTERGLLVADTIMAAFF